MKDRFGRPKTADPRDDVLFPCASSWCLDGAQFIKDRFAVRYAACGRADTLAMTGLLRARCDERRLFRNFKQMRNITQAPMGRGRFLRGLFGGAALFGLPFKLLSKVEHRPPRTVRMLEAHVRGFNYHDGPQVIGRLRAGDALQLVREPGNDFDRHAIAIHWNGRKLGYVPREENSTLARMMDQGVPLQCAVIHADPEAPTWEQCTFTVQLAATGAAA